MWQLLSWGLRRYSPIQTCAIPPPHACPGPDLAPLEEIGPHGVSLPFHDEDGGARSAVAQRLVSWANRLLPLVDRHQDWEQDSPVDALSARFGKRLPAPRMIWGDLSHPDALGTWVRQGIGAHRVHHGTGPDGGDCLLLSMDELASVEVRAGLEPYGGVAWVAETGAVRGLRFGDTWARPGDDDWAAAAFRFRSSVLVGVTFLDHLGTTHYGVSNAALVATRRSLPLHHPLRGLLRPFQFRTAAINANALATLIPRGALAHRASSLTDTGLASVWSRMLDGARFEPFEEGLRSRGVHPEQLPHEVAELLPWSVDGILFHGVLADFVADALDRSAGLRDVLQGNLGEATRRWWDDLAAQLPGGLPALEPDTLHRVLTWLVFTCTAVHSHVGHVAPAIRDPEVAAGRVWPGSARADPDNSAALATMGALTGIEVPTIDGDLAACMPDPGSARAARQFRTRLDEVQAVIDERNKGRPVPFHSFSPRHMPCSVSR